MNLLHDTISHLRFSSPFLFLVCAPLIIASGIRLLGRSKKGKILLSDLQQWKQKKISVSSLRWTRIFLLATLCIAVGITWARPQLLVSSSLDASLKQETTQQFLFLLDLSGSMGSVEGASGSTGVGMQKFEAVRQAFSEFVQQEKNPRIGLILFSDEAFVVAYPTHDHLFLEKAILQEDIQQVLTSSGWADPYSGVARQSPSQLARFSQGTSIANALDSSLEVLNEEAVPPGGRAVILITDLGDDAKGVVAAIARLRKADARVYVVGVEMDQDVAGAIIRTFGTDIGVKLYSTQLPQEIRSALYDISIRERAVTFSYKVPPTYVPFDLFVICASVVFVALVVLAMASETLFFFFVPVSNGGKKKKMLFFARYMSSRRKE